MSFDNGKSWTTYKKSEILDNGITFTDEQCSDLEQIRFKGGIKKLEDISIKSDIDSSPSDSSNLIDSNGVFGFYGNYVIPDSATSIGTYAFAAAKITSIVIPNSVTSIEEFAFVQCRSLISVTIPDSVNSIGSDAFNFCTNLKSVTIGKSLTYISSDAFQDCTSLTSVIIPDSVTKIGQRAFYGCSSLTTINYTGTEEQWNAIPKYEGWNTDVPSDCVINYNYKG